MFSGKLGQLIRDWAMFYVVLYAHTLINYEYQSCLILIIYLIYT